MTVASQRSGQSLINTYLTAIGITASTATSDQRATALAELNDAYREMLRGVYQDERGERLYHMWSFMHPVATDLSVSAQGNAALTSQDIVFTAADAEAAGEDVSVVIATGSGALSVSEDTDTSVITVTLAAAGSTTAEVVAACSTLTLATVTGGSATAATALASTNLKQTIAGTAMPSGFGGLLEAPRFQHDPTDSKGDYLLRPISPEEMDGKIRDWDGDCDDPSYFCLRPKAQSTTLGSLYEMVFFPPPASTLTLSIRYRVDPADLTDSASTYAVGNTGIEQLIVAQAKANKELQAAQAAGPETRKAMKLFADCVFEDRQLMPVESRQESMATEETGISV
jgi:hypothetical protein